MAFPNALLTWKVTPVMSGIFGGLLPRIIQDHTRSSQDRSLKMCWCCEVFGIWEGFLRGSVKPSIVKLFPPLSMSSLTHKFAKQPESRSSGKHQRIYWTVFGFTLGACKCHSCKNFSCHSFFCTKARAHVINCSMNNACKRTNARSNGSFCMLPYACRANSLVGICPEWFHWKQGLYIYWWMTDGPMDGRYGSTVCCEKASAQCRSPAIQSWITVMRGDCLSHAHFFWINSHRQYCIWRFGWQKKKLSTSFHFPGAIPQTCRSTHPVGAIAVQCLVVMIMELVSLDMSEECRGYVSPLHCFNACALNYFISVVLTKFLPGSCKPSLQPILGLFVSLRWVSIWAKTNISRVSR